MTGDRAGRRGGAPEGAGEGLTYRAAGVDVDAGNEAVRRIRERVRATFRPEVIGDLGGFGGLFRVPGGYREPVLVAGADGVGTKLRLAFELDRHETVGIDCVAMNVNDLLVQGAEPLFFLDYLAVGRLDPAQVERVVAGVAEGCRRAGCALIGGETAEMPGFYPPGEYDLAGFAVGIVERSALIDGSAVRPGDRILGLASSGLHSNGFSLARKALLEVAGLPLDRPAPGLDRPLGEVLLEPTRIYVSTVLPVLRGLPGAVNGIVHITGGGFVDNVPRVLPPGCAAELRPGSWPEPPIFELIRRAGPVSEEEMRRTFNLGLGLLLVVDRDRAAEVAAQLEQQGERAYAVGRVVAAAEGEQRVRFVP